MSLKNIIGQEKAVEMLFGFIKRQRIATSYLFCGEPGIGKKTTAINFAKALNCVKTGIHTQSSSLSPHLGEFSEKNEMPEGTAFNPEIDACDECDSCTKIEAGTHPDFLLVLPEERQIRIEEIRLIENAISFKPFEGRKKIVVVDDADAMNISSANAFLKTLEEPPDDSIIILVSSKPDRLPVTIRSRCSKIHFGPLSPESCRSVLNGKILEKSLELVTRLSMGRPGIALCDDLMEEKRRFLNLFKGMLNTEKDSWTSREDMDRWFELALTLIRDVAVLKITGEASNLINIDLQTYLNKLSNSVELKDIIYVYNELNLIKGLLMFNLNKSITWNFTASILRKELSI